MRTRIANLQSVKQPLFTLYKERGVYDYPDVVKAFRFFVGKREYSFCIQFKGFIRSCLNAQLYYSSNGQVLREQYLEG